MFHLTVTVDDSVSKQLSQFGAEAPRALDNVLKEVANKYKQYVIRNFLSGQMLPRRTGGTQKSLKAVKSRKYPHTYWIYSPAANLWEFFKKRPRRPFMSASAATFDFDDELTRATDKVVGRELRKRGL
jgi:hypothetical protein